MADSPMTPERLSDDDLARLERDCNAGRTWPMGCFAMDCDDMLTMIAEIRASRLREERVRELLDDTNLGVFKYEGVRYVPVVDVRAIFGTEAER